MWSPAITCGQGIPKIPTALADELNRLYQFRSAAFSSWHQASVRCSFVTRFADTPQFTRQISRRRADADHFFKIVSLAPATATAESISFSARLGRDENFKVRLILPRHDHALTEAIAQHRRIWSNSGEKYAYGSTRRNGQDVDIWIMNPANPKSDRDVARLRGWLEPLDFSADDRQLLLGEFVSANEIICGLWMSRTGKHLVTPNGEAKRSRTETPVSARTEKEFTRQPTGL